MHISTELLPVNHLKDYEIEQNGRTLHSLIPQGRDPEEFFIGLATKFKSVSNVYRVLKNLS